MKLLKVEKQLWNSGITYIAGVDESGRGPLAGPLVVAAVILDKNHLHNSELPKELHEMYSNINDSKKLSARMRSKLNKFITTHAISYSVVEIGHRLIDLRGITKCTQLGFYRSVKGLSTNPDHVITDYFSIKKFAKKKQSNISRGDSISISVASASILAKVHRDSLMENFHEIYPKYLFNKHKGYGTKHHMEALKLYGPCKIHRKSFKPVYRY